MALGSRLTLVVTCLTLVPGPCRAQNDCFTSSSIVGAVLGTFFSTAIALALLVFLLWWIYYRRSPNGADRQSKGSRAVESGSGFDNPCFEANPNSDVVDGSKTDDYNGRKDARSTSWTPLRFFGGNKNEKKRSMDDSFISEPERVSVQLRGHDFTGLGFSMTGNMRDGIFIKDISNRGPAFESGKIAPGDRILNVTISFRHVVYEDALTILSYASPYDVTMELEKGVRNSSSTLKKRKAASTVSLASASPSVTLSATAGSVQPEGPQNERLVHPLYRSQSIDDLSKVGRADTIVSADLRIPNLSGQLGGNLVKSKLLGKANLEFEVPDVKIKGGVSKPSANVVLDAGDISVAPPDVSLAAESRPSKISKFAIKVLPDFKFKGSTKSADLGMTQLPTGLNVPEAELNLPKVEIHVPKASELAVDIDVPDGSAVNLPKPNVSMAIDMPEQEFPIAMAGNIDTDVKLNIEAPSISVSAPVDLSKLKLKEPTISQPSVDLALPAANLDLELKSPSLQLPDVAVDQDIPNPEVSVDLNKTMKSGFHIKFPKFGGSTKSAKVDVPEVSEVTVNIATPQVDVALPEANLETDLKLKKEGSKAGFEFKMPKLSLKKKPEVSIDAKAPIVNTQIPDVKLPEASLVVQPPILTASAPDIDVQLPSASIEVKKPKIGFSMPKFNMGKNQGEPKESINVAVDVPSAQIDLPQLTALSDDDEAEGGKKKLKFGKMPKIGKPEAQINISVPDISADVEVPSAQLDVDIEKPDVKTKNIFGFKLPKVGASATVPDVNLDVDASVDHDVKIPNVDVKLPSVDVKVKTNDTSSSSSSEEEDFEEGGKKKKRFNIKMPKFGLSKGDIDVNAPNIAVDGNVNVPDVKPIEGNVEFGVPNVSVDVLRMHSDSSEESDSDDEGKKKKKSSKYLKVKAPEIQLSGDINTPSTIALPSLALPPIVVADVSAAEKAIEVDASSMSLSAPVVSSEIKLKELKISQPNMDISLPSTSANANVDIDIKSSGLPDVAVGQDIPNPEVSIDVNKAVKSGFHIKFPKFGGSKTAKVDTPEVGVNISAPEVDVALPEASLEIDPKLKKDGAKVGFEFKMPKLSLKKKPEVSIDARAPTLNAQIPEVDVDVKMPTASIGVQPVTLAASGPDVELPSASVEVKKPKMGFSMPKFHMGKSPVEPKESINVTIDAPSAQIDLPQVSALSDDDEAEGGKKKMKFGKMKFGMNKPQAQVNVSVPDGSAEVEVPSAQVEVGDIEKSDVKTKHKFGFKLPKIGGSASIPDVDVDASVESVAIKLPKVAVKADTSDSLSSSSDDEDTEESRKKKKKFNIKLPKFGSPKAEIDVNLPSVAVEAINANVPDIKPIEGNLEIKAPKVSLKTSSHSDDSDSNDEKERKKKGSIGLAVEGIAIDADAKVALDTDLSVAKKKGSKFGIKFPKLHADKPRVKADSDSDTSSDDDDEGKGKGITIAIPSVDLSKPDASVELPSAQLDIGVKQPKVDLETETGDHETDDDEIKKKSSKFGFSIKMPKFHMKKKSSTNIDIDLDKEVLTQLHVDAHSAETDEDPSSEDNLDKKKGKVSVKLPKFGMKKPEIDADLGLDKPVDVRADVKMPKAEIDLPDLEIDVKDGDKEKSSFSIKMPEFSIEKPKLEMDLDSNNGAEGFGKLNVDTGKMDLNKSVDLSVGGQVQPPSANFSVVIPSANVELPDVEVEVEHDDLDDEKKKSSKFFKMPKFHMGRHHGEFKVDHGAKVNLPEKGDAELNLPSTKLEFDSNVSIDLPSKDDVDSDDEKKDKKKPRFGIKLPKFQMKQPQVSGGVDIKPEDISLSAKLPQLPSVEANVGAGLEGSISADSASVDMELPKVPDVVSPIDVDVAIPDIKVEMPEKDGKKKGKFSFKSNFKMPKLHMSSGKGHAELEAPSADISLPKVELDSSSRGETDEDFDVDIEKKKSGSKFGAGFKMPKMRKPTADGDVDVDVALPTLNVEVKGDAKSDDSSDDEDKESEKKKSGGFAFKMPKLHISGKSEVDLPEVDPQLSVKAPSLELEEPNLEANIDLPEGELSKKSPFIVKMPALSPMKQSIDLNVSTTKRASSSDSSSSDSEDEKSKKGFKLGFKMPQLSMPGKSEVDLDADIKVAKTEVDLPSVDAEVSLPEAHLTTKKKSSFGSHFKMPSFSTKTNVGVGDVALPDIDIETPRMEIQEEGQVVEGAEDESEKKDQKIGIKLPKFQMRQRDADVPLPQVELKTEDSSSSSSSDEESEKELKVKVKKPKFGIKLPEFNKPKLDNELPKKDLGASINVQPPTLAADPSSDIELPQASVEIKQPSANADISNVDIQVGNIDAEVAKVKAQLAQLQAEFDIQSGKQSAKKEEDDSSSSSSDCEIERRTKSSGLNFGLKMPKFSLGKEKVETEVKLDVAMPTLTMKNNGDEMTSPSLSSLEVEPVKLESGPVLEKEKKKFSLGLKMPKFPSKTGTAVVENEVGASSDAVSETKPFKVSVKGPKMKLKKKKGDHRQSSSSDSSSEEENNDEAEDQPRSKDASGQLMGVEVKLPRVQVYKNVEYQDAEKGHNDSSSDEEDEVKDIKKNIGARFGVKLKKPKMFSSSKVEITGKSDSGNNSSTLQPEWKLPRVDLRRASKSSDQELSVDVDLDLISEQQKLEQLSPSERADAIRRDSKSSAGIRLHSPSYISLMPSPRSKKPSLETLDVESSPKLLSVTRLDPTPPIETSATMQQPMYGNIELTTTVTGPQVSASQVPSSVIMASDAVKMKRGPPTPARRSIVDPNSSVFQVVQSVITTDVTVEGVISSVVSEDISSEMEINLPEPTFTSDNNQQASDTDISISTSTGSDTLVISPSSSSSQQEAHNRKASSLGDLTRIPTSGSEDGSLERTVSLDFKPVSTLAGNSSRAIYNLAVQDLSRVGEDSDEDYNLNRKRPTSDHGSLEGEVTVITVDEVDAQSSLSSAGISGGNRTLLTINTDDNNVTLRPLEVRGDIAEALWFGSTSIQTVESVQTTMSYTQMEESISTDVTLTTTSLGTSPSETSSSSSSEGSPFSPASPEPSGENTPNLVEHSQVENGRTQQYHTEMTELAEGELGMSGTRTITLEMTSLSDDSQPQPLTDLNPSAGNFAAVRNRFEQLSGTSPLNGAETTGSLGRNSGRLSQTQGTVIKRLSGNFEELPPSSVNVLQKSFMQHIAPELSEGALSRTVIISSLTLERAEQNSVSPTTGLGPESPVPNLEPPC